MLTHDHIMILSGWVLITTNLIISYLMYISGRLFLALVFSFMTIMTIVALFETVNKFYTRMLA